MFQLIECAEFELAISGFNSHKGGKMQNLSCVPCDQALRGGQRKESLQLRLWNLNICIEKVNAKC